MDTREHNELIETCARLALHYLANPVYVQNVRQVLSTGEYVWDGTQWPDVTKTVQAIVDGLRALKTGLTYSETEEHRGSE